MTTNRITKLYDSLTAKQRAALMFNHWAAKDDFEVERIARSVPIVSYRGRDPQHLRWLNDFSEMASAWGLLHWRGRCATLAAMWAGYAFMRQHEYEQADESFQEASQGEARLLALDAALNSVCSAHGIDPSAVRELAGTEVYRATRPGIAADLTYQEQVRAWLSEWF
jgi:hypothetical protein